MYESSDVTLKKLQVLKEQVHRTLMIQAERLLRIVIEDKETKDQFMEKWNKELKAVEQKVNERLAFEFTVKD